MRPVHRGFFLWFRGHRFIACSCGQMSSCRRDYEAHEHRIR